MKRKRKIIKVAVFILFAVIIFTTNQLFSDDIDLFTAKVKPNVMVLMDNSGSMNTLIFHPDYDPNHYYTDPSDGIWYDSTYKVEYYRAGKYYDYHTKQYKYFAAGYYLGLMWNYTYSHLYKCEPVPGTTDVVKLDVKNYPYNNAHPNAADTVYLYIGEDKGNLVRIPGNFLNFLIYDATPEQLATWNHFEVYGNWDAGDPPSINGGDTTDPNEKILDYGGDLYYTANDKKIRIRVARMALTEVLNDLYNTEEEGRARIGFTIFENGSDPDGGTIQQMCQDNSAFISLANNIKEIEADTWTPLSETYAELWAYFRHGGESHITQSQYFVPLTDSSAAPINRNGAITNWCQMNFILIVTDGEPTQDDYLRTLTYSNPNIIFNTTRIKEWGDPPDLEHDDDNATLPSNGTNYLDDLAYYAYNNDIFPDDADVVRNDPDFELKYKNKQYIITYTVGFTVNNQLLKDTAENGGGKYYTAKNYNSLVAALREAFFDIIQRAYSFSSFTAPKKVTTAGTELNVSFVGSFIPRPQPVWEGHVIAYDINEDGSFGNERWDAAEKIPEASQRHLYTLDSNGNIIEFSDANASALKTLLGVTTDSDAQKIINFIRGERTDYDPPYLLGDLFHSDIQFIGSPLAWKKAFDSSYETFYENYKDRKKVIYFGTNDGIMHQVDADPENDPSSEGKELYGFIPDEILPKLKTIAIDRKHQITVDGRISADDIFYTSGGNKIWRTMLYFGLRNGGKAYYAFDVSDPNNPTFKWKFGKVNSGTQPFYVQYLGYTWGKPAIGMIKYKTSSGDIVDKYVVILTGGYADNGGDSSSLEGKAIFFVDAWTGDLLWMLGYASSDEQTSDHYLTSDEAFNYPIPSSLTAIDLNNDNYLDTLYFGNTYGNLFKLDISDPDPENWEPVMLFHATYGSGDPRQPIYLSPAVAYDNCYNLWVTFGTGDRADMKSEDKGRLIAVKDTGSTGIEISDLQEIVWSNDTFSSTYDETKKGFYFDFTEEGEKMFDPEPVILPDNDSIPHLYFNTYRLPTDVEDPCTTTGEMTFYDIKISTCPAGEISGEKEGGRVAGGGFFKGKEYIMYEGTPDLGSTTVKEVKKFSLPYAGGLVYWKEKRR